MSNQEELGKDIAASDNSLPTTVSPTEVGQQPVMTAQNLYVQVSSSTTGDGETNRILGKIEVRMENVEKRLDRIEDKLENINDRLEDIEVIVNALKEVPLVREAINIAQRIRPKNK